MASSRICREHVRTLVWESGDHFFLEIPPRCFFTTERCFLPHKKDVGRPFFSHWRSIKIITNERAFPHLFLDLSWNKDYGTMYAFDFIVMSQVSRLSLILS